MPLREDVFPSEEQKLESRKKKIQDFVSKAEAFRRVFSCPDGEIVLNHLKSIQSGFDKDPYQHAFNAGKARIMTVIESMMDDEEYKKHLEYLKGLKDAGSNSSGPSSASA